MDPRTTNIVRSSSKTEEKVTEPPQCRVILINDDYTTKEFVTEILIEVFHKTQVEATALMERVHLVGSAEIGVYSYDIASTRVSLTLQSARKQGFPLQCKMQEV